MLTFKVEYISPNLWFETFMNLIIKKNLTADIACTGFSCTKTARPSSSTKPTLPKCNTEATIANTACKKEIKYYFFMASLISYLIEKYLFEQ